LTLNPKLQTLNPKPQTLDPNPELLRYSTTDITPVFEGSVVTPAAQRYDVGSRDVSEVLGCMLRGGGGDGAGGGRSGAKGGAGSKGVPFTEVESNAIRDAVGAVAVSREALNAIAGGGGGSGGSSGGGTGSPGMLGGNSGGSGGGGGKGGGGMTATYTLPDGNVVTVHGAARLGCVEALFQPARYGLGDRAGVSDALLAAIMACSADQRRAVLDAVAVSGPWAGGAGGRAGLDARILSELEDAMPPALKPAGAVVPEYMPGGTASYAAWIGGSILAKVVFPQNQHMSKIDYQEHGPSFAFKSRGG
jgi:hypothetical protein